MSSQKITNVKRVLIVLVVIVCLAIVGATVFGALRVRKNAIEDGNFIARSQADSIQYAINIRLAKLQFMDMAITKSGGVVTDFATLAQQLHAGDGAIKRIQIAPNGVVTEVYPAQDNFPTVDLFNDPLRMAEAIYSRDYGVTTITGPYDLIQGGNGVVARRPIYVYDSSNTRQFWGFAILVLDLPTILAEAGLDDAKQNGYDFQLWRHGIGTGQPEYIAGRNDISPFAITKEINLGQVVWQFSYFPIGGWLSAMQIVLFCMSSLLLIVMAVLVTYIGYRQMRKLSDQAIIDPLTGLLNRSAGEQKIAKILRSRDFVNGAFVLLDIDNFKVVNDTFGHFRGDEAIRACAKIISGLFRDYDVVYRMGGDEFVVFLPVHGKFDFLQAKIGRLLSAMYRQVSYEGQAVQLSASVGIALAPMHGNTVEELFKHADTALYTSKQRGRNCVTNYADIAPRKSGANTPIDTPAK